MRRIVIGLILGAGFGSGLTWLLVHDFDGKTTLSRLSPDETLRASLVERESSTIERTFEVRLEDLVKGESALLYRSPGEGTPFGTERLIWSKDGRWLLLVGRHFFVKEDFFLDNGDQVYLLYDVSSKQAWINSAGALAWPSLKAQAIDPIEFTEPIRWKPR